MENKKNIFVIDDDEDIAQLIDYNLQKEGYKTFQIQSGIQAIWEISKQHHPDCILLDIMMPSPDGFEICNFLKNSEDYREIPVILVSAKGSPEDIERGLELGADAFLPKPFSMDTLVKMVRRHSNKKVGEIRFPHP